MRSKIFQYVLIFIAGLISSSHSAAAQTADDFHLQVTPSPLFTTLKPGTETMLELKIRNAGSGTEELRIDPRSFSVDNQTGQVTLDDTTPSEIAPWISFSAQKFTVKPGQWYTQRVYVSLPKDTGFSYSLALIINRANDPTPMESGRNLKGSVAVFTLINVDRPGATRKVEVTKFSTSAGIYEYLPVTLNMQFKNTGNTIVQPYGNVFIQRAIDDEIPLATLPVNDKRGYILPGSERLLTADWKNGFPIYQSQTEASGTTKVSEVWDWSRISDFRIGNYTAKLVAVYNDGQRDVPLEENVSFWVLPWKILLGALITLGLVGLGVWTLMRKIWLMFRRAKHAPTKSNEV